MYCSRCGNKIIERTEPCTVCGGIVTDSKMKMIDYKPEFSMSLSRTYNEGYLDINELQNVNKIKTKRNSKSKSSKKIDRLNKYLIVVVIVLFLIIFILAGQI